MLNKHASLKESDLKTQKKLSNLLNRTALNWEEQRIKKTFFYKENSLKESKSWIVLLSQWFYGRVFWVFTSSKNLNLEYLIDILKSTTLVSRSRNFDLDPGSMRWQPTTIFLIPDLLGHNCGFLIPDLCFPPPPQI